jgi:phospholipid/cholesterol/gamma-HCH transport system permease protein
MLMKPFFQLLMNTFKSIGRSTLQLVMVLGRSSLFLIHIFWYGIRPPFYVKQWLRNLLVSGFGSLFLIALTALFTGMVLALQLHGAFARLNLNQVLPEMIMTSMLKELGPVLTGLMMAGRLGAAIAAEIGTMRVTEQIDALITLSTHPIRYLIIPRLLGSMLILPVLTMIANVIGVLGGYLVGVFHFYLPPLQYLSYTYQAFKKERGSRRRRSSHDKRCGLFIDFHSFCKLFYYRHLFCAALRITFSGLELSHISLFSPAYYAALKGLYHRKQTQKQHRMKELSLCPCSDRTSKASL